VIYPDRDESTRAVVTKVVRGSCAAGEDMRRQWMVAKLTVLRKAFIKSFVFLVLEFFKICAFAKIDFSKRSIGRT